MTKRDFSRINAIKGFLSTENVLVSYPIFIEYLDDKLAGDLLSQIFYWYLPTKNNESQGKLRVWKKDNDDGEMYFWIAKTKEEWEAELFIKKKPFERVTDLLIEKNLIKKQTMKFNGQTVTHIRLIESELEKIFEYYENKNVVQNSIDNEIDEMLNSEVPKRDFSNKSMFVQLLEAKIKKPFQLNKDTKKWIEENGNDDELRKIYDVIVDGIHNGKTSVERITKAFVSFINATHRIPNDVEMDKLDELATRHEPRHLRAGLVKIKTQKLDLIKDAAKIEEFAVKEKQRDEQNNNTAKTTVTKPQTTKRNNTVSDYSGTQNEFEEFLKTQGGM